MELELFHKEQEPELKLLCNTTHAAVTAMDRGKEQ